MKLSEEFNILGRVKLTDGKKRFVPTSPAYLQSRLEKYKDDTPFIVSFSTRKPTRSRQHLNYYFVLVSFISEHTGFTKDEMHDILTKETFGTVKRNFRGREYEVRRSVSNSAQMTTADMMTLTMYAQEVCADLGIVIPSKEELGYIEN